MSLAKLQDIKSICKNQLHSYTLFLYTSSEQSENEIKKAIPIIIASNRIKYLRINLTKEYYKTLLNEKRSK